MNFLIHLAFFALLISLFIVSHYAVLFLFLAILPGVISLFLDKRKEKFASKTIVVFNFMSMIPFAFQILFHHNPTLMARMILIDPMTWIYIYCGSMFGWVVIFIVPNIIANLIAIKADLRERSLSRQQTELVDEWGEDVRYSEDNISVPNNKLNKK